MDQKIIKIKANNSKGYYEYILGGVIDLAYPDSTERRGRVQDKGRICPTLSTVLTYYVIEANKKIKRE